MPRLDVPAEWTAASGVLDTNRFHIACEVTIDIAHETSTMLTSQKARKQSNCGAVIDKPASGSADRHSGHQTASSVNNGHHEPVSYLRVLWMR